MNLQPFKIAQAWYNYGLSRFDIADPVTEELAQERAEKCGVCEFKEFAPVLSRLKDGIKEIESFKCTDCGGCPLVAKLRGSEKCRFWNE